MPRRSRDAGPPGDKDSGEKRRPRLPRGREGREPELNLFIDPKFRYWNLPAKAKVLLVSNVPQVNRNWYKCIATFHKEVQFKFIKSTIFKTEILSMECLRKINCFSHK